MRPPGRAPQLISLGKTLIEFVKDEAAKPSAGSAIDHIGLSYADAFGGERAKLKGRIDALRYGGVAVAGCCERCWREAGGQRRTRHLYNLAWTEPSVDHAEDPNGILIESIQTLKPQERDCGRSRWSRRCGTQKSRSNL